MATDPLLGDSKFDPMKFTWITAYHQRNQRLRDLLQLAGQDLGRYVYQGFHHGRRRQVLKPAASRCFYATYSARR
jgi:hypothetical protein